jgi:hypothetical protein
LIRPIDAAQLAQLQPLVDGYPFKPYRHYRVLPRKRQSAVLLAEMSGTAAHHDGLVLHANTGNDSALIAGRRLAWDSDFFGVPMARIDYAFGSSPDPLRAVLAAAVERFRERGVRHVSARADVADIALVALLEEHGFRMMDALVTYTTRPHKEPPNPVREVGRIRELQQGDAPQLLQIAADAYRGFRGRFHLDPHIPNDRCDTFYVEWAQQCLTGHMADTVLVSEGADGQLLGFLAWRRREPVSSVGGVAVFGGGLGACRSDVPGAYAGLIRAGTIWAHAHEGVAECQTQNYNFPTIRIYEAVGAHYVRAEYTLHAWLR